MRTLNIGYRFLEVQEISRRRNGMKMEEIIQEIRELPTPEKMKLVRVVVNMLIEKKSHEGNPKLPS